MSDHPAKAADVVNIFGIVLIGIASALLLWATAVALQGYYMSTSGTVEDERATMELESERRTIQAAQVANLQRSEANAGYQDSAETCYRNPIESAMRLVVADAEDDTRSLVPAVGPHDKREGKPIPGYHGPGGMAADPVTPTIDPNATPKVKVTENAIEITEKIQFETGSATIAAASIPLVEEIAAVLVANPRIEKLEIQGHTDNEGDADANVKLSKDRADAVMAYLTGRGIDAGRLDAVGLGPSKPMADNSTEEGREKNRRVEFVITKQRASNDEPTPEDKEPTP